MSNVGGGNAVPVKLPPLPPMDQMTAYIDGKMRRYNLLFAVNGGIIAIAGLFEKVSRKSSPAPGGSTTTLPQNTEQVPLAVTYLDFDLLVGFAILFTGIMMADIWAFGLQFNKAAPEHFFKGIGKFVSFMIGILFISAWSLLFWWRDQQVGWWTVWPLLGFALWMLPNLLKLIK